MTKELLRKNLAEIKKGLTLHIQDPTNGVELVNVLNDLMQLQSLSADCCVRSESLYTEYMAFVIESGAYDKYPASDKKHLIQRDCLEFSQMYSLAEKYNKEIHYRMEAMRTLISNAKELLKQNI